MIWTLSNTVVVLQASAMSTGKDDHQVMVPVTHHLLHVCYWIDSLCVILITFQITAWGFGDPHITTLDGRAYTFNGWGEYILLQFIPPNNGTAFSLQGRMVPLNGTSATQFSAFALGNKNGIYGSLSEVSL